MANTMIKKRLKKIIPTKAEDDERQAKRMAGYLHSLHDCHSVKRSRSILNCSPGRYCSQSSTSAYHCDRCWRRIARRNAKYYAEIEQFRGRPGDYSWLITLSARKFALLPEACEFMLGSGRGRAKGLRIFALRELRKMGMKGVSRVHVKRASMTEWSVHIHCVCRSGAISEAAILSFLRRWNKMSGTSARENRKVKAFRSFTSNRAKGIQKKLKEGIDYIFEVIRPPEGPGGGPMSSEMRNEVYKAMKNRRLVQKI